MTIHTLLSPLTASAGAVARKRSLPCKICGAAAALTCTVDFAKHCEVARNLGVTPSGLAVSYYRCPDCQVLFTADFDSWTRQEFRDHIYNDGYAAIDPDFQERRPVSNARLVARLFGGVRDAVSVLDYGGGNGRLAAALAALGFRAATVDPFYGPAEAAPGDIVTAFEVIEHLPQPWLTLVELLGCVKRDGVVLFSTLPLDGLAPADAAGWWYLAPRNGHVTLYHTATLHLIARRLGLRYARLGPILHVFVKGGPAFVTLRG